MYINYPQLLNLSVSPPTIRKRILKGRTDQDGLSRMESVSPPTIRKRILKGRQSAPGASSTSCFTPHDPQEDTESR